MKNHLETIWGEHDGCRNGQGRTSGINRPGRGGVGSWEGGIDGIIRVDERNRVLHGSVRDRDLITLSLGWRLARDQTTPRLVAFMDNLGRILFVLGLSREGEGVLRLAIG